MTWLIQQTQTTGTEMPASPGFFNWTTCSNLTHPYAWANTLEGDSNGYNVWWYINPINDTFGSTTAGSNFQSEGSPLANNTTGINEPWIAGRWDGHSVPANYRKFSTSMMLRSSRSM
jgi:hypothetical protein